MPSPDDWNALDKMIGPSECDEAAALAEVFERLTELSPLYPAALVQPMRAAALVCAVVARRLEVRGVAKELMHLPPE